MNERYGPCVHLPVLMYHHIQDYQVATQGGYQALTVTPDYFSRHLQYLADHGYQIIPINRLTQFFDSGTPISSGSVLITFDDGYADFSDLAFPILQQFHAPATMFLPTGLMENPGYLSWAQISSIAGSGLVYFANHTWSHHSAYTNLPTLTSEVNTAQTQLADHGLNPLKIFSYPYGSGDQEAQNFLQQQGYSLAFTTKSGSTLCRDLRLTLPRIRVGNADLSAYGF
jgi:peptidoglycan/xylan/chitin deacetylase (PgdA/CDA1 family)